MRSQSRSLWKKDTNSSRRLRGTPNRYFQLVFVICLLPRTLHGQGHVQIHVIRAVDVQLNRCFRLAQEVLQSVIDKVLLVLLEIVNVHPRWS